MIGPEEPTALLEAPGSGAVLALVLFLLTVGPWLAGELMR